VYYIIVIQYLQELRENMPAKASGEIKKVTVNVTQKNGDIYVYERNVQYLPEDKKTVIHSSRLIGKIPKGSKKMIKTRPKRPSGSKRQEENEKLTASRNRIGMMKIVEHMGKVSGIDDAIYHTMDEGTAQKIISIARFWFATGGNTLTHIENWQYTHPLPYVHGISEDIYHSLFSDIGINEEYQQRFFQKWGEQFEEGDSLAFDSTTESTYSNNIIDAQYGFNKDRDGLKTIKLLTLYSINKRLPVHFTKQPGYISDVISLKSTLVQMEAIGIKIKEVITDNGFHSNQNLANMLLAGFDFITLVKTSLSWIKPIIEEKMRELEWVTTLYPGDMKTHGVCNTVMHTFEKTRKYANHKTGASKGDEETFERRIYVHVYFNRSRQTEEIDAFDRSIIAVKNLIEDGTPVTDLKPDAQNIVKNYFTLRTWGNKVTATIDTKKMEDTYKHMGYFVLVSNSNKDSFECLEKYRKREWVENFFTSWGQNADGNRPRVWDSDTLRGKLFVQFISLCYYEFFSNRIREIKAELKEEIKAATIGNGKKTDAKLSQSLLSWMEKKTNIQILQWFDMVEEITVSSPLHNKRWNMEISARDRLFLEKLGITLN